ncbi:MAG: phosphonoacetaldehyde hydrolase [Lactobacillus sp.]|jgi:phosphonoacetaldehyde hydrolase|nr:phosphonoacetaldehyde hydrolase [Lactobacillus sp.]
MRVEAVVFDWAGTTVDFGSLAPILAFKAAFKDFGIDVSDATIRQDIGLNKLAHVQKILADSEVQNLWQEKNPEIDLESAVDEVYARFQKLIDHHIAATAQLTPGMPIALAYFEANHIKVASTSGYTQPMIATALAATAPQGYAPLVNITSELTAGVGRPAPDMLNLAIQELGVSDPQAVIKVGDTINDILEAKNAGAIAVGVINSSNLIGLSETQWLALDRDRQAELATEARKIFTRTGADYVIATMAELPALIDKINTLGVTNHENVVDARTN